MKKINKKTFKIFIYILLPIILLWIGIIVNNTINERENTIERAISEAQLQEESTALILERYIIEVIENLKVIRDANEFDLYFENKTNITKEEVEELFIRIMNNKVDYDYLRYIDVEGNEVIRVDNDETTVIAMESDLKYVGDEECFKEALNLGNDKIYISDLNLNVENGIIEEPQKPMLRIATPIYDDNEILQGIVVINYKAEYFLEILSKEIPHGKIETCKFQIINGNGEYIINADPENNFSFMFEDKKDLLFENENENENSEVWEQMLEDDFIGSYVTDDKAYSYYDAASEIHEEDISSVEKWIIVHEMDISELFSLKIIINELVLTNRIFAVILIMLLSFVAAYFIERVRSVDSELEITKKIASATNDAVVITDKDTIITYVNNAYEEATGYTFDEVIGFKPSDYKSDKHDDEFYKKMWESINDFGSWEGKMWDKRKDGVLYPKKIRILSVKDKKNTFAHHYLAIFSDMSGAKRKSDKFNSVYYKEGELVIPNEKIMVELLEKSTKNTEANFMMLYIAIENYNQLVSSFENYQLDISSVFANLIYPVMNEKDFVAQTESNLFVAIISIENMKMTQEVFVNNLRKEIGKVINIAGRDVVFKTRIGVSLWPNDTKNIKRLLLNSMIALEWTSRIQESEIAFFNEQMIDDMNQENEIESYLGKAIQRDELRVVYQPQIDIKTGKIIGMEALLRWDCKELGSISPAVFIPIAERKYLIIDIGTWVIERVCQDIEYLNSISEFATKKMRCAINISAIQMSESGFTSKFLGIVDKYKIQKSQLEVEITEGLLFKDEIKNLETLDFLRKQGITVAIDDFGTGYSSLSYLQLLPIDKIKIDRSFIKNYPKLDDGKLAKVLVEMSKTLNITVLTEGAEEKEQVDYLKEIGCNYIQGFYYSKPLELEDFIKFIIEN